MRVGFSSAICAVPIIAIAVWLATVGPADAARFRTVYAATSGSLDPEIGATGNGALYVVDPIHGTYGQGAVFALKGRTLNLLYSFTGSSDGGTPNRRLQIGARGELFGTTRSGGAGSGGTIFRLTRTGALTTLYAFESATGVIPYDGLAEGPHGTFFGTASQGANSPGNGTIVSGTAAGGFSVLYYFLSMQDGHCPFTGVVRDAAGNLFGTTVGFGFGGQPQGSVFEYTAAGQLNTLYSFTDGEDGEWPQITPTLDASGNVWGVSAVQNGGQYAGAVWSIESSGFSVRYAFGGSGDGWQPNGPLLLARNGVFYGTTVGGGRGEGSSGYGTVFSITSSGAFTTVHAFRGRRDGAYPTGRLVQAADGKIYGGTQSGTIFAITP